MVEKSRRTAEKLKNGLDLVAVIAFVSVIPAALLTELARSVIPGLRHFSHASDRVGYSVGALAGVAGVASVVIQATLLREPVDHTGYTPSELWLERFERLLWWVFGGCVLVPFGVLLPLFAVGVPLGFPEAALDHAFMWCVGIGISTPIVYVLFDNLFPRAHTETARFAQRMWGWTLKPGKRRYFNQKPPPC